MSWITGASLPKGASCGAACTEVWLLWCESGVFIVHCVLFSLVV